MSVLRVGLVGCGRVTADLHLPAIARVEGVEAVALADVDAARAQEVARRFGVARVHPGADALAADGGLDLVAVCTPPRTHAAAALAAIGAGRHVLVEKPLVLELDEADALRDAAHRAGVLAMTGFSLRTHRQVREAREAIADGRLGALRMIRTRWTAAARPAGWRSRPGEGGGVLWELGIHHLDLWRHLTGGEPEDLQAIGDDHAVAVAARVPGGPLLSTTLAAGTSDGHEIELVGEHGRLTLTVYRGDGPHWAPAGQAGGGIGVRLRAAAAGARTLPRQARAARAGGDYRMSFAGEWAAIRDAVAGTAPPHATLSDGRRAVALALEAERLMAAGGAGVRA
jgi:predicted dehydrogenase